MSGLQITAISFVKWFDYVAVTRPMLLLPVWTQVILGYYHATWSSRVQLVVWWPPVRLVETLVLYSCLAGGCYIVNQISDSETDSVNQKLYLVADGHVGVFAVTIQALCLIVCGLSWAVWRFGDNLAFVVLTFGSVLFGLAYSLPPIRLKGKPILDLFSNAIGYGGFAFWVGWSSSAIFSWSAVEQALPYALCVAAAFVNTTIPDMVGDRASGDWTTSVWLGERKAGWLSLVILVASIVCSYYLKSWFAFTTSLICLPFFVRMNLLIETQLKQKLDTSQQRYLITKATILTSRVGILVFSIIVGILVPIYLVLFACTIFVLRWYYAERFGIKYP